MPDVADFAHALTDAAVVNIAAAFPLVAGGAVALSSLVASGIAWLCYTELRSLGRREPPLGGRCQLRRP